MRGFLLRGLTFGVDVTQQLNSWTFRGSFDAPLLPAQRSLGLAQDDTWDADRVIATFLGSIRVFRFYSRLGLRKSALCFRSYIIQSKTMAEPTTRTVFLTGSTGFIGGRLEQLVSSRGHYVKALARFNTGTISNLPKDCHPVFGDAVGGGYESHVAPADTFVHLVGVSHPNPSKAELFRTIDLKSVEVAVRAAQSAQVRYFVYISVAHPAPVMKA